MDFTPERLLQAIARFPVTDLYWVAFSGGLDSTVLLHALSAVRTALKGGLAAVHVDHGLSPQSSDWDRHCARVAGELGIRYESRRVDARPGAGESPEAAARRARYHALEAFLASGQVLLTAHHQEDQAETLLLRLFRGAGHQGLSAMRELSPLGPGYLGRPLLEVSRSALRAYAQARGLKWIDDPSNFAIEFDRNFLRHEIMPRLQDRWPAVTLAIARSARHLAESASLLDELAEKDWVGCSRGGLHTLSIDALKKLDPPRRRNLLRYWLRRLQLPPPDSRRLTRVEREVLGAAADRTPLVSWSGAEVRRYRDALYASEPLGHPPDPRPRAWDHRQAFPLPVGSGRLTARSVRGQGISAEAARREGLSVRFRIGGERCRLRGRRHHRDLKRLFQEAAVPPWLRSRVPLVFVGDELAWIGGMGVCSPWEASEHEEGLEIAWEGIPMQWPIETKCENDEN